MASDATYDLNAFLASGTAAVDKGFEPLFAAGEGAAADDSPGDAIFDFRGWQADASGVMPGSGGGVRREPEEAMPLACAVECIHTYSLIHDDLPAMDDDDLRRGKPTNHKVFGEGIAVLAGDALLTQAFEIAALCKGWARYPHRDVILEIALAAGSRQLIAGQVADLEGEGKKLPASQLKYIHERKTSALLCCSVRLGGMSANCPEAQLKALTEFGYNVGLAFQIIDDILDVTQSSAQLGKNGGERHGGAEGDLSFDCRHGKIAANRGAIDGAGVCGAAHLQGARRQRWKDWRSFC